MLHARYDPDEKAVLHALIELRYAAPSMGLPGFVRAASALRRFRSRLVIAQDDVDALAVCGGGGDALSVILPARGTTRRQFDDTLGNKDDKLDLEACVVLPRDRLVAFGSGSLPVREQLVVWDGAGPPRLHSAGGLYARLRTAFALDDGRLNIEGAVVSGERLLLFHRGNDGRVAAPNAVAQFDLAAVVRWLDGATQPPAVERVITVDLGDSGGVRFGFTDAVAVGADAVIVLACAEDTDSAIADGAVLGCRVGAWTAAGLRMVDVCDPSGTPSRLKLEGIESRGSGREEFDVVVDVDSAERPAQFGRLRWSW
jgi:hypothetical protein